MIATRFHSFRRRYTRCLWVALLGLTVFSPARAATDDFGKPVIHGELMIFAVDHSNPQYNRNLDASFIETTFKLGTRLSLGEHLSANLRGAFGSVWGQSRDLTFVQDETDALLDIWNLEGTGLFGGHFGFTLGRQEFGFGDGFLVWDGVSDKATVWTAGMRSMPGVRVNFQQGPLDLTLFSARTDKPILVLDGYLGEHHGKSRLHGAHLAINDTPAGNWEIAAFVRDDDSEIEADTIALSVRGEYTAKRLPALSLEGELVKEAGTVKLLHGLPSSGTQDRDAWGGHLDAKWKFTAPLHPYLKISRITMSGDDPTTRDYEGYDPMLFGWVDWGTWFVGSISSWEVFSTNERVSLFELGLRPSATTHLRLQFYDISLDREWSPGAGRNWSREINTILDWTPPGPLIYGLAVNYAQPQSAAKAFMGDDQSRLELMAWLIWNF